MKGKGEREKLIESHSCVMEAGLGGFELGEHTADILVVGRGADLGEALAWTATGMFSVIADLDSVAARESIWVSVTSTDREALVVDWLNELLYIYEAEGFLPRYFDVTVSDGDRALKARCTGEPADAERHGTRPAVKAATYHGLRVTHDGGWRIQVVLDL